MFTKSHLLIHLEDHDFTDPVFDQARNDKDIALAAIEKDPQSYCDLGWEVQSDPEIIDIMLRQNGASIKYVPDHLISDEDYKLALSSCPELIMEAPLHIQENKDIVLSVVKQNGKLLKHLPQFHSDRDVVREALKHDVSYDAMRHENHLV